MKGNKKTLSREVREDLLAALETRFNKNMNRHKGLEWAKVQAKLEGPATTQAAKPQQTQAGEQQHQRTGLRHLSLWRGVIPAVVVDLAGAYIGIGGESTVKIILGVDCRINRQN